MIENYTRKIFLVDDKFLSDLRDESITSYNSFKGCDIDTQILSVSNDIFLEVSDKIPAQYFKPGNLLVKADYSNRFNVIDELSDDIAFRKYSLFLQLCIALGAKEFSIRDLTTVEVGIDSNKKTDVSVNAEAGSIEGGGGNRFLLKTCGKDWSILLQKQKVASQT